MKIIMKKLSDYKYSRCVKCGYVSFKNFDLLNLKYEIKDLNYYEKNIMIDWSFEERMRYFIIKMNIKKCKNCEDHFIKIGSKKIYYSFLNLKEKKFGYCITTFNEIINDNKKFEKLKKCEVPLFNFIYNWIHNENKEIDKNEIILIKKMIDNEFIIYRVHKFIFFYYYVRFYDYNKIDYRTVYKHYWRTKK